jgi:sirohydrochlorin cobaltochelatase
MNAASILVVAPEEGPAYGALAHALSRTHAVVCVRLNSDARAAVGGLVARGASTTVAVPFSCGVGPLEDADVAALLRWAKRQWPDVTFVRSERFAAREHVVGWASRRAHEAMTTAPVSPPSDTAVLVVAETGAPAANAEVSAISRLLWEHHDYAFVETAFLGTERPSIAQGLERCRRLRAEHVVVVPLTLLDGPALTAIEAHTEAARKDDDGPASTIVASALLTPESAAGVVIRRHDDALARWFGSGIDGCGPAHTHVESFDPAGTSADVLPPRYRGAPAVSASSMRSAPLQYDPQGRVAWDRVWRSFCDLALAGGPPHRGTLLEPPTREEVLADPAAASRVAAEVARGLSLVTGLPVAMDAAPGWVGLVCFDEDMAVWLLRAIVVENVSVRRSGAMLFLPAGPDYRVEKEIKNVITAVAKTHHYWTEHRGAR